MVASAGSLLTPAEPVTSTANCQLYTVQDYNDLPTVHWIIKTTVTRAVLYPVVNMAITLFVASSLFTDMPAIQSAWFIYYCA